MKTAYCVLILALFVCGSPLEAQTIAQRKAAGWTLTFDDEFNGKTIDTTKWNKPDGKPAIINNELQAYIDKGTATLSDGVLYLTAKHERGVQQGKTQEYISGELTTHRKFSQAYGYFEARCKMPKGRGLWPAVWLLPEPGGWPPEIDIMEWIGKLPNKVYFTNHWKAPGHKSNGKEIAGPDFSADFHTFAVDWEPEAIVWYLDGVEKFRSTQGVPTQPFYIIVNLAMGGSWGGPPDRNTQFPASFEIDYVRVFQKASRGTPPPAAKESGKRTGTPVKRRST
jgi:beta-glucanase (GH16 family)